MKITCTHGNKKNGIKGSRITLRTRSGVIVDQFVVPSRYGIKYCEQHKNGKYGKRYWLAINRVEEVNKIYGDRPE